MVEKGTEQQSATSMDLASPQLELFALITPPASPCQQNTSDPNPLGKKRLPGQPRPVLEGIILLLLPRHLSTTRALVAADQVEEGPSPPPRT